MTQKIFDQILKFRDDRNWKQFHNPKDLAISISIEAAELLENFQWQQWEEAVSKKKDLIEEELADVFIYSILMSDVLGINIFEAVEKKLKKNEQKYPIEKSYGNKAKYTELE